MKLAMIMMLGAALITLGACQTTDVTGPQSTASDSAVENSPDNMHQNVERGDVYLEENIDRYDLDRE